MDINQLHHTTNTFVHILQNKLEFGKKEKRNWPTTKYRGNRYYEYTGFAGSSRQWIALTHTDRCSELEVGINQVVYNILLLLLLQLMIGYITFKLKLVLHLLHSNIG